MAGWTVGAAKSSGPAPWLRLPTDFVGLPPFSGVV